MHWNDNIESISQYKIADGMYYKNENEGWFWSILSSNLIKTLLTLLAPASVFKKLFQSSPLSILLPPFHLFKNTVFAALLSQSVLTYSKSKGSFEKLGQWSFSPSKWQKWLRQPLVVEK